MQITGLESEYQDRAQTSRGTTIHQITSLPRITLLFEGIGSQHVLDSDRPDSDLPSLEEMGLTTYLDAATGAPEPRRPNTRPLVVRPAEILSMPRPYNSRRWLQDYQTAGRRVSYRPRDPLDDLYARRLEQAQRERIREEHALSEQRVKALREERAHLTDYLLGAGFGDFAVESRLEEIEDRIEDEYELEMIHRILDRRMAQLIHTL